MPFPQVIAVAAPSPADDAGVVVGDEIRSMNGATPRDVIEFRFLADESCLELEIGRGGLVHEVTIDKRAGEPLGVEVSSPLFDRVRTCDNHCEFCFIYQLPKGMRRSLYVKDDDYRLSFLYGNFTTLTRFTEIDLERVVTERLSPLYVSIHATDPRIRSQMLRNRRGAMSLRWLRQLLDHGIEVHGQIVCCPGVNDGAVLDDTLAGILERFPELASAAVVPLGISQYTRDPSMRRHTTAEAQAVIASVATWQRRFRRALGHPMIYAADEYYLLAGEPFPPTASYGAFPQLENGIGMARDFEASFAGRSRSHAEGRGGFFASVDGAPATGYRAPRGAPIAPDGGVPAHEAGSRPVTIVTGTYGAAVLGPILARAGVAEIELCPVENTFFGGNIGVAGLLTGSDLRRALERSPAQRRYLLPDVCLSEGRFLDGLAAADLPRRVEVVEATGAALRRALAVPSATSGPSPQRGVLISLGTRR